MSTVQLSFSPDPAYVRTVRLVAAAVARRAGVSDEVLDEVRLAIGEACTRAVAVIGCWRDGEVSGAWQPFLARRLER